MRTEDLGQCISCGDPFTEYDVPAYEVEASWQVRIDGKWQARGTTGFVHEDCLDRDMTITERIER